MEKDPQLPQPSTDQSAEPICTLKVGDSQVTLLGTAHVSKASAEQVKEMLETGDYDAVAIELCPSRYNAVVDPEHLEKMDLFQMLREGKTTMVVASLALGAYQQRMAEEFGIEPGAEMRAAISTAEAADFPVLLIDREVGITLKRIYRSVPWWRRYYLITGLVTSVVSREKVSEDEIERLKEGDILEATFEQFAEDMSDLYRPLIDDRDRYMAARLIHEAAHTEHRSILAVVGAGHVKGIRKYLQQGETQAPEEVIAELNHLPPPRRWPKLIPWAIVALILTGFALGFSRNVDLGWQLVLDWVLINGGLSALGALGAAAHPLTIIGAFVAAPLTSLNPTIGAGMVTGAIETWLRKPKVGEFSRLRKDTAHLKGWWSNHVARIFLVFLFSTIGSAIGTYVAGFRIFDRLTGG
ncbi:MAG: TraB/GumN family protein [Mariprofundaceae bacterium]